MQIEKRIRNFYNSMQIDEKDIDREKAIVPLRFIVGAVLGILAILLLIKGLLSEEGGCDCTPFDQEDE